MTSPTPNDAEKIARAAYSKPSDQHWYWLYLMFGPVRTLLQKDKTNGGE